MQSKLFSAILRSIAITVPSCLLLLVLSSAALTAAPDPAAILPILAYAILVLGAAICGFLTVRFHRARGLLCGALSGAIYSSLLLIVGLALGMENCLPAILLCIACIAVSAVFGYLALPKTPSAASVRRSALLKAGSRAKQSLLRS